MTAKAGKTGKPPAAGKDCSGGQGTGVMRAPACGREARRGMFFTIAAMLLAMALLTIALPVAGRPSKAGSTVNTLLGLDETAAAFANIQEQLTAIRARTMNVSAANGSIEIDAALPVPAAASDDLYTFLAFASEFSGANVSANISGIAAGSFMVRPVNVSISHNGSALFVTPDGAEGSQSAVSYYRVELTFPEGGVDDADWEQFSGAANGSPDGLPVIVVVRDARGASYEEFTAVVDRHGTSVINITGSGAAIGFVRFVPPAALEVLCYGNADLKALAGFNRPVYVETEDVVGVGSHANKSARLRIS